MSQNLGQATPIKIEYIKEGMCQVCPSPETALPSYYEAAPLMII